MQISSFGVAPALCQPAVPSQTHWHGHAPTPGTSTLQSIGLPWASAGCAGLSSARPLQSSSMPLQVSTAGVRAEQPTHPFVLSQVSIPRQVPTPFFTWQPRSAPSVRTVHVQTPLAGTHCFVVPRSAPAGTSLHR